MLNLDVPDVGLTELKGTRVATLTTFGAAAVVMTAAAVVGLAQPLRGIS